MVPGGQRPLCSPNILSVVAGVPEIPIASFVSGFAAPSQRRLMPSLTSMCCAAEGKVFAHQSDFSCWWYHNAPARFGPPGPVGGSPAQNETAGAKELVKK